MIIVTGSSKGIGLAICHRLAEKGEKVFQLSRNGPQVNKLGLECDVSSPESVEKVLKILKKQKYKIKGLINVAGIASMNLTLTTPPNTIRNILDTNLFGTINCCKAFAPLLIRNNSGFIINFSTIAVALNIKGEASYAASKAGVETFTKTFAREMADFNINVNCIAPGPIKTDLTKNISQTKIENIISRQLIPKQFGKDDICDVVELLIDSRSKSLSGQIFSIGGC